jgi:hypothetical protein
VGRAALILVTALLAAVAAGCGGDGDDDDGIGDLATRADAICARTNAELAGLDRPMSFEQLIRYVDEAATVAEERLADLEALPPPDDRADDWAAYVAANERAVQALGDLREATVVGRGGQDAERAFDAAEADARERARELGLTACAQRPPTPEEEEGETETTTTAPATTAAPEQSQWAARADRICTEAQTRIDALPAPTDPAGVAAQLAQVVGIANEEIQDLRALTPPPDQVNAVQRFLDALGRSVAALERVVDATVEGDEDAIDRALSEGQTAADQAQREADVLGLTACGRE